MNDLRYFILRQEICIAGFRYESDAKKFWDTITKGYEHGKCDYFRMYDIKENKIILKLGNEKNKA